MPSEAKEAVKVTQADKDIAAEYMRRFPDLRLPEAFARHREEAEKRIRPAPDGLREALSKASAMQIGPSNEGHRVAIYFDDHVAAGKLFAALSANEGAGA